MKNSDKEKILKKIIEIFKYCKSEGITVYLYECDTFINPEEYTPTEDIVLDIDENEGILLFLDILTNSDPYPFITLIDFPSGLKTWKEVTQEFLNSCVFSKNLNKQVLEHFKI